MTALLVDIGNSRIKWRFDDLESPASADVAEEPVPVAAVERLFTTWRAAAAQPVATVLVSAVASPAVEDAVSQAAASVWPGARVERVVASAVRAGVTNGYPLPSRLGPDRWLAMIGAHALFAGRPLLVCGFGTATTIDLLVPDGVGAAFVGGLILPGLAAMRHALGDTTARLPSGVVDDQAGAGFIAGAADFALETDGAIAGGLVAAQVGAVERSLRAATRRLDGIVPACIVAGGAAGALAPALAAALDLRVALHVVSELVLHGLAVVARETPRKTS